MRRCHLPSIRFEAINAKSSDIYYRLHISLSLQISENVGYKGHLLCVEAFDRAVSSTDVYPNSTKNIKILDVGAGTGGIGEMLKSRGYTNVDALDISQEMLNVAASKNLYKKLICAPLTDTHMKEIETAEYDVVLCGGVIAYGQTPPGAIEQCARFVKPGRCKRS